MLEILQKLMDHIANGLQDCVIYIDDAVIWQMTRHRMHRSEHAPGDAWDARALFACIPWMLCICQSKYCKLDLAEGDFVHVYVTN